MANDNGHIQNSDQMETIVSYDDLSRRDARSLIFHFLYAAESFDYKESLQAIVDQFNRGFNLEIPLDCDVVKTTQAIIDMRHKLDEMVAPFLVNWRLERIGCSTRLVLRFAVWEFTHTDTDYKVVINEAIELAKCFAEKDAYKFVNGILDELSKSLEK